MKKQLIFPMEEKYEEYLTDESKYKGFADSISFPETEDEIITIVSQMNEKNINITIQGGKTGIVGSCVPLGGHILNLSKMNHSKGYFQSEDGTYYLKVEPCINLLDLQKEINKIPSQSHLFWPPEPTEPSSTVGGIASTNAKGICSYLYGESKQYFVGLKMISQDETIKEVIRGKEFRTINGKKIDYLDMLLGSEGMAGVFTEFTLRLLPKPEQIWGISFFFETETEACAFAQLLKEQPPNSKTAAIGAIEYMDRNTIDKIEERKESMTKLKEFPDIEKQFVSMIYLELHGKEEGIEELAEFLMEQAAQCGSDPDKAWAVTGENEIEKMRAFRHGAAETVNLCVEENRKNDTRITKLGADYSIQEENLADLLAYYKESAGTIPYCIFGHIGKQNHIHINLLPADYEEYEKGRQIMKQWAERARGKNGQIVCEHGIGKLKKELLPIELIKEIVEPIKLLKEELDSVNRFNSGNAF